MTSVRLPGHLLTLLLLLYITADFMDPLVPGVFFFDNDALFVDGAIQFKSTSTDRTPLEPLPVEAPASADCHDADSVTKVRAVPRPLCPQPVRWERLKHHESASFASSSAPDSSPSRPQS